MLPGNLCNLKAEVLAAASSFAPSTIRGLVHDGLLLGHRIGEGHPKYDLADVSRLIILDQLRRGQGVEKARAIRIVNRCLDFVASVAEQVAAEVESSKAYSRNGGPWLVAGDENGADQFKVALIATAADLLETIETDVDRLLVVRLRNPILLAHYRIGRVIAGEVGEYAE